MRYRIRVSGVLVAVTLLLDARVVMGEDAPLDVESADADALSFFDYLGSMVDADGDWLDPLELVEQAPLEALGEPVDAAAAADTSGEAQ